MTKKEQAMEKLREAASLLMEAETEFPVSDTSHRCSMWFPGWDFENVDKATAGRYHAIRDAAFAILNHTNYDHGVGATVESVSFLVRFIGDMLEE
jgi:hypothetical protein